MFYYEWVLFDADDTLFHFDAFSGLKFIFLKYGIEFTLDDYLEYQAINKPLWVHYQNGNIAASELQVRRFDQWANRLKVDPEVLNNSFLAAMADICTPLDGAISLLDTLKPHAKLGIITNGFTLLQQARLEKTGLKDYFQLIVVSEEVGVAKPHPAIFDYALTNMGNPEPSRVLMVGDNPDSDILGGLNAGLDTCWLNMGNKPLPPGITPKFAVSSLHELKSILSQGNN